MNVFGDMSSFGYLARNFLRNSEPEASELDEWWVDDATLSQAFMAGAKRMLQELSVLQVPGLEGMERLLETPFSEDEAYFIAFPTSPDDIFGGGMLVRFGGGKSEPLAKVPCPLYFRKKISRVIYESQYPAVYSMAFRMIQEFYGHSPVGMIQLAPLLADYLMEHHNLREGIQTSFTEVLRFCQSMIVQERVTRESLFVSFYEDDKEKALPWMAIDLDSDNDVLDESNEDQEEQQDRPESGQKRHPLDPEDGLPF
jgi:hypothetical protein